MTRHDETTMRRTILRHDEATLRRAAQLLSDCGGAQSFGAANTIGDAIDELLALRRVAEAAKKLSVPKGRHWYHSHQVPGVWDVDNGPPLGGTRCEECAAAVEFDLALAALEGGE